MGVAVEGTAVPSMLALTEAGSSETPSGRAEAAKTNEMVPLSAGVTSVMRPVG